MRKTRFVCVSDTHNSTPNGSFKLPKGDVLIHAGDMTNQGTFSELKKTIKWIEEADFEAKIVIAGNHDITLDSDFYNQYGSYFHNQNPQDPAKCQELLEQAPSILWLKHEHAVIDLVAPTGPHTTFKIFGSPFSPAHGMWAFGYGPDEAAQLWDRIPLDTDIVVTHTPPQYHCDERKDRRAVGCEGLRNALWRVRPHLAISGHVHEGRGVERVRWDLDSSNIKYKESGTIRWEDPGRDNKKLSMIDLTTKSGSPLANDGSVGDFLREAMPRPNIVRNPVHVLTSPNDTNHEPLSSNAKPSAKLAVSRVTANLLAVPSPSLPLATLGQGGPPSPRSDMEALSGRMGRQETCIVNAAIMASSWPRSEAKKFNKPIVVDIDLPVWKEC
ncbi:Metallo-dependent phosphatase [Hyaloscypha variabilis F]|uniref:Metallo-dependent phosphatase n=1 Tax=Hyaloscypha variabilis (strain UAMH 11265 / GT02V1 / F) TaxID=1149755 RepID=A0A2J6R7H8_HYAVF|nr:Metallo-dependent phosphatase [Hyaloscypha variabilis F]